MLEADCTVEHGGARTTQAIRPSGAEGQVCQHSKQGAECIIRVVHCHRFGVESVRHRGPRIASLLCVGDAVLLTSTGPFAGECEAAGMRVSSSKSEATALCGNTAEVKHGGLVQERGQDGT